MVDGLQMRGQVAVVTGGTKGIGRAIAERFLTLGAHVVVGARSAPDAPVRAADGSEATFAPADVGDPDQARALIEAAVARHGRVDVVVNNAGGTGMAPAATVSPRSAESIIRLNLIAPLYVAQAANQVMQEQPDGGLIINIGSVAAHRASPGTAVYGAAKAGLTQLTKALALEWAPRVRVNQVTAGLVQTPMAEDHYRGPEGMKAVNATVPLGRMATPEDIAGLCGLLVAPEAGYLTGVELVADGGGQRPAWFEALGRVAG